MALKQLGLRAGLFAALMLAFLAALISANRSADVIAAADRPRKAILFGLVVTE